MAWSGIHLCEYPRAESLFATEIHQAARPVGMLCAGDVAFLTVVVDVGLIGHRAVRRMVVEDNGVPAKLQDSDHVTHQLVRDVIGDVIGTLKFGGNSVVLNNHSP